jgi:hypothetical protein
VLLRKGKFMKIILKTGFLAMVLTSFTACSKSTTPGGLCGGANLYDSQASCQSSSPTANCSMTTVPLEGQNVVCWQQTTTNNNTGGNNNGNNNTGSDPCAAGNPAPAWVTTAWTPAQCDLGVTQQTRTVTCPYACPCSNPVPSNFQTCVPDLYGALHYSSQCTSGGGTVTTIDGKKGCLFQASSCPSGWYNVQNGSTPYTATISTSYVTKTGCMASAQMTLLTGYHSAVSATAVETAQKCTIHPCVGGCSTHETVYATVTKRLCY